MEIQDALSLHFSFFREEGLKNELVQKAKVAEVGAGTLILKEGAYVKIVPLLINGLVKVVKEETGGKEMLLYYIYPHESCIVSINCGINEVKSPVKAIAEDDSTALMVPSTMIGEWQRKYPSFNRYILNLYQTRFDALLNAYNALAFQSLDERLTAFLIARTKALNVTSIKATHQDLADELGTARETISRMLKKLELDGKVVLHRGTIEVISTPQ